MMETQFNELLDRITAEVLRRAAEAEAAGALSLTAAEAPSDDACTVVLVPSVVPYKKRALEALSESFGAGLIFVSFDGTFHAEGRQVIVADESSRGRILEAVEESINVVLLSPTLSLIRNIAAAEDGDFLTYLFIRAQLWGKKVSMYLDFELPHFRKARYGEKVSDALEALKALDVPVVYYLEDEPSEPEAGRSLITETDVLEGWRAGRKEIACRADAIVTPLAKDKAAELGLVIRKAGEVI